MSIRVSGKTLSIDGVPSGTRINVFDTLGRSVVSTESKEDTIDVSIPTSGVYVVTTHNQNQKIIVR